jgi:hypothetical protein
MFAASVSLLWGVLRWAYSEPIKLFEGRRIKTPKEPTCEQLANELQLIRARCVQLKTRSLRSSLNTAQCSRPLIGLSLVARFAVDRAVSELRLHHSKNASDVRILTNSQVDGAYHRDMLEVVLQLVRIRYRGATHEIIERRKHCSLWQG